MVVTLAERKHRETERLRSAAAAASTELAAYAAKHGGRFILFGSAARGELVFSSDLDLVADFAPTQERRARDFAEATCRRHGIRPDIVLMPDVSASLAERLERDGVVLK